MYACSPKEGAYITKMLSELGFEKKFKHSKLLPANVDGDEACKGAVNVSPAFGSDRGQYISRGYESTTLRGQLCRDCVSVGITARARPQGQLCRDYAPAKVFPDLKPGEQLQHVETVACVGSTVSA